MQIHGWIKKSFYGFVLLWVTAMVTAQSVDGWYKVFTGKMGNYDATLHLHKTNKNYSGYLWFKQSQVPMQLYYNEVSKQTDSLMISANNGPLGFVLSGILSGNNYTGIAQLMQEKTTPQQAGFQLQVNTDKTFTQFNYYYTEGFARMPPQLKNQSECHYTASIIWPSINNTAGEMYKNEIRKMLGVNTPVEEIGKWIIDEKNRYISGWKTSVTKYTPKEAADMGLSLTLQEELRVMVMYENEKYITIANFGSAYTGGAHGSFATNLSTFNKLSNKKMQLSDVISPAGIQQLPLLLDKVVRTQLNIKNGKPLSQNGFVVAKIKPSQYFYLTGDGIGFVYAPYTIKSFADGEINLLIPFNLLKSYLKPAIISK